MIYYQYDTATRRESYIVEINYRNRYCYDITDLGQELRSKYLNLLWNRHKREYESKENQN